jgi:23S rRNA pseudouridine2605 synthase
VKRYKPKSNHQKQKKTGLARAISKLGFCSRSQAAAAIKAGTVRVNGMLRTNPETPVSLDKDKITVNEAAVSPASPLYFMINKPRGIVTTASDEKGRDTVYSCLPPDLSWLAPVGRLDQASEGLLLFTNDSGWASRITAPESHIDKTYHVQVAGRPEEEVLQRLRKGVITAEGDVLRAKNVGLIRSGEKNSWLEIILDEGKNRQIRRMLEHYGFAVLRLVRIAIGPVQLGELPKSGYRELTRTEKDALDRALEHSYPRGKKSAV